MKSARLALAALCFLATPACGGSAPTPMAPAPAEQSSPPEVARAAPSEGLVAFASAESMERLDRSAHKIDFFTLANHFEGQQHGGMCGPTTAVIVLNALRPDDPARPVDPRLIPDEHRASIPPQYDPLFRRYTQGIFFADERVSSVKSEAAFYGAPAGPGARPDPGMQLRQLHDILVNFGLDSTLRVVADDLDERIIREELIDNLGRAGDYVVVNYHRKPLGQAGGGHISPLGAYDQPSDSFLVLDVNPNGKTWVWVPAAMLIDAMRTFDTVENRGYLLIREGDGARR